MLAIAALAACEQVPVYREPPAGSYSTATMQVSVDGGTARPEAGASVTREFFTAADARPLLGRLFLDTESASSETRVAVLSHALWTEQFAASPSVIGSTVVIDGQRTVIVGVMPKGFTVPGSARLWIPK
jgi:hypothetical protein